MIRLSVTLFVLLALAAPASAQSTYVGASLVGNIVRFSGIDYDDDLAPFLRAGGADDEAALGFNVTVGREIARRVGVEFEFAHSSAFDGRTTSVLPALLPELLDLQVPVFFEARYERRHTSLSALLFARQDLGERIDLTYLGGVAFSRVTSTHEYDGPRILIFPPRMLPSFETTSYGAEPQVGIEAALKFGAAAVTGGVRLQTVSGFDGSGWLIRPNVGMRWTF